MCRKQSLPAMTFYLSQMLSLFGLLLSNKICVEQVTKFTWIVFSKVLIRWNDVRLHGPINSSYRCLWTYLVLWHVFLTMRFCSQCLLWRAHCFSQIQQTLRQFVLTLYRSEKPYSFPLVLFIILSIPPAGIVGDVHHGSWTDRNCETLNLLDWEIIGITTVNRCDASSLWAARGSLDAVLQTASAVIELSLLSTSSVGYHK